MTIDQAHPVEAAHGLASEAALRWWSRGGMDDRVSFDKVAGLAKLQMRHIELLAELVSELTDKAYPLDQSVTLP